MPPTPDPVVTLWLHGTHEVCLAAQELALPVGRGLCWQKPPLSSQGDLTGSCDLSMALLMLPILLFPLKSNRTFQAAAEFCFPTFVLRDDLHKLVIFNCIRLEVVLQQGSLCDIRDSVLVGYLER